MTLRFHLSIFLLLLTSISSFAQHSLSTSRQSSKYILIYPIDDPNLEKLYKGEQLDESILKAPIDSCLTDHCTFPELPQGNYLKVFAQQNALMYSLFERPSATIKLLQNKKDLQFLVLDPQGNPISDAEVSHDRRRIHYDTKANSFHTRFPRKSESLIKVRYKGILNIIALSFDKPVKSSKFLKIFKSRKNQFDYHEFQNSGSRHNVQSSTASYLVFNKPKYKPQDTLKFKAFILNGKFHRPVKDRLSIKLTGGNIDKHIGFLDPQSAGSYTFKFLLHDSLKLSLDQYYDVQLMSKDKVYAAGSFQYEDYELKSIAFTMRGSKMLHNRNEAQSLYFKATDENGLNVMDGRVEVVVMTSGASNFHDDEVFVPDTLWNHTLKLDQVGETKLELPDSIFPKADLNYYVAARFLNSDNQQKQAMAYFNFSDVPKEHIQFELKGDSLFVKNRDSLASAEQIYLLKGYSSDGETVEELSVRLPTGIKVNSSVDEYELEGAGESATFDLSELDGAVELTSKRTKDSLTINAENPRNLPVWFTVLKGNKVVDRGLMKDNHYRAKFNKNSSLTFIANYLWADKPFSSTLKSTFADKVLNFDVSQPAVISPGEKANIQVAVSDAFGKPVKDVDLTAYAITSKFDTGTPIVPYLGKQPAVVRQKPDLDADNGIAHNSLALDYRRWASQLGLDSIEYFRFTHPTPVYRYAEPAPEGLTQIVPFLIENGRILPIEILYLNEQPVFFSKAQQQKHYAFLVNSTHVSLRFRLRDKIVTANHIPVTKGERLVISLNLDTTTNKTIQVAKAAINLSDYEAAALNSHMIKVEDTYSPRFGVIRTEDQVLLLDPVQNTWGAKPTKLVGPLKYDLASYTTQEGAPIYFNVEPNSTYTFSTGFLRQRTVPQKPPFSTLLSNTNAESYKEKVLSNKAVDSLWEAYLDLRSHTTQIFELRYLPSRGNGRLTIRIKNDDQGKVPFVKNIILYSDADPGFRNIYPGNTQDVGYLTPGRYKMLFLLKGDRYMLKENIIVKANGTNAVFIDLSRLNPADSLSRKIADVIKKQSILLAEEKLRSEKVNEGVGETYTNPGQYKASVSGIVYSKEDKKPIIGVLVRIKGTKYGVYTDASGSFTINVPDKGKLEFLLIGFKSQEHQIDKSEYLDVHLDQDGNQLDEVVLVGYGARAKKSITGELLGNLHGVQVSRAMSGSVLVRGYSTANSNHPILVVDGKIVEGDLQSVPKEDIAEITMLKNDAAVAIYGPPGKNGVILITTKKAKSVGADQAEAINAESSLRRNFSDYAFWQPTLRTDQEGKANFSVTFPDDITRWRTFFIGMNAKAQSGFQESTINAFKALSAALVSPAFAISGDTFAPIGKLMNYTSNATRLHRTFTVNGAQLASDSLLIENAHIDTFKVVAKGLDSLTFRYSITKPAGSVDGEERKIPVFNRGVLEHTGRFEALDRDTTLTFSFIPKLGPVTFHAESSILPMLLDETEFLRKYEYLCNEQLASKLKGLLAQKRIKAYLGEPFTREKDVKQLIRKLAETRRADGTWGWWANTDAELWISKHVLEAFIDAEAEGFKTSLDRQAAINQMVQSMLNSRGVDRLEAMLMLKKLDAKLDYAAEINRYEDGKNLSTKESVYERFKLIRLRQSLGEDVSLDELAAYRHVTMMGNVYYGPAGTHMFDNSIQISLLAYQIVKASKKHPEVLEKLRNYFLEQRRSGTWRNTFESALILETILPDLLVVNGKVSKSTLILTDTGAKTVTDFPYTATLDATSKLKVEKKGQLPVYVTAYQQFWNADPQQTAKGFAVKTWFETKGGQKIQQFKGGEAVVLKAEVDVEGDADYVMVEVPIPAGCSYDEKEQSWWGTETHREYAKNKVSIFCKKLKAGKYTFDIKLLPRYNGQYTLNPAKAEMMYFPVFYGREGMKQVLIGLTGK